MGMVGKKKKELISRIGAANVNLIAGKSANGSVWQGAAPCRNAPRMPGFGG